RHRSSVGVGVVLILLGAWFLAVRLVPGLAGWVEVQLDWPLAVVGAGVLILVIGLLVGAPGMAVPACVVGGIGGILWWQNASGDWESWSYVWALIPGFVGLGTILAGLFEGNFRRALVGGIELVFISLVLFAIFGSLFGELGFLGVYWPVLLVLLGLLILVRGVWRSRRRRPSSESRGQR
ncbi:MAG: hypothetical protein JW900_05680, partial [Anaerolineae bacterium]|nr:hypothetical protein [Anaerolineae bacterium]